MDELVQIGLCRPPVVLQPGVEVGPTDQVFAAHLVIGQWMDRIFEGFAQRTHAEMGILRQGPE